MLTPVGVNAGGPVDSMGTPTIGCDNGSFTVTVPFSHRGPAGIRIWEYADPAMTVIADTSNYWFRGSGDEVLVGTVGGGSDRYFKIYEDKVGPQRTIVIVGTPWTGGPYSCTG